MASKNLFHFFLFLSDETSGWTGSPLFGGDGLRLENGQAVQLEDGTTAYIHTPGGMTSSFIKKPWHGKAVLFGPAWNSRHSLGNILVGTLISVKSCLLFLMSQRPMARIHCRLSSWKMAPQPIVRTLCTCPSPIPFWPPRQMTQCQTSMMAPLTQRP